MNWLNLISSVLCGLSATPYREAAAPCALVFVSQLPPHIKFENCGVLLRRRRHTYQLNSAELGQKIFAHSARELIPTLSFKMLPLLLNWDLRRLWSAPTLPPDKKAGAAHGTDTHTHGQKENNTHFTEHCRPANDQREKYITTENRWAWKIRRTQQAI